MKNCIDQEELQLTKTHMMIQQRPEVEASIKRLKRNKAPGEDNITGGILQDGGDAMIQVLTDLFNTCCIIDRSPKHGRML